MFGPNIWRFGRLMDPLTEMQRLQRDMNRILSGATHPYAHDFPTVNVWTGEHGVLVTAELPGMDPETLDISVMGETLTLSGARKPDVLKEGERYHRQERSHGQFTRALQLPFHVDAAKVEATYEKGVLQIRLPRAEEDKPKKIKIKSE